jgi:hypothetical protein
MGNVVRCVVEKVMHLIPHFTSQNSIGMNAFYESKKPITAARKQRLN